MLKAIPGGIVKLDFDKATEWLDSHWQGEQACPVCGKDVWGIHDEAVEIRPYSGGQLTVGGPIFPYLAVICMSCGNTMFFNALHAGLLEQPE